MKGKTDEKNLQFMGLQFIFKFLLFEIDFIFEFFRPKMLLTLLMCIKRGFIVHCVNAPQLENWI